MRLILNLCLLFILIAVPLAAQESTYDFLRLDMSARASALNGSFVSMKDDPNVVFYNPASIGTISKSRISASYLDHLMDVNAGSLSYGQDILGVGTIGAGISYINYGSFTRTDEALNVIGTFNASELAFLAGIAGTYEEDLYVGANIKYIYSSIAEYSSSAMALDCGILYDLPEHNLTIGASILNLGTQLKKYNGVSESLPLDILIGLTSRPEHLPMLLNLNFHRLNDNVKFFERFSSFTIGSEILMSESFLLRIGYNNKQRKDSKMGTSAALAGFSMGAGIIIREYQLDYAFNSYGKIGGLHRISLGMSW